MTKSLLERIPQHIREVVPYQPGKPVEEVERELGIRAIKLASNENPLGPSPLAVEAARKALAEGNRYPDGGSFYLREKIAARYGVGMEAVFVGLGSSEVIDLAARVLLGPGLEAVTSEGSYPPYAISTCAVGAKLVTAPLKDYAYDLNALAKVLTPETRIVFLANPNNPTGTYFGADALDKFLRHVSPQTLVVLDEAYFDFVEDSQYSRSIALVKQSENILVLRTFSKVYGLAGLRVGFGIGPAGLLVEMDKLRTAFNTASIGQAAALAAMDDVEHVRRSVDVNRAGRKQIEQGLAALGVRFVPSAANFVFVETEGSGATVGAELLKQGVIARPMGWMGFPHAIRISVGLEEENRRFLEAFERAHRPRAVAPRN